MIEDHDNEEDYYPVPDNHHDDYPDDGSHLYDTLSTIDEVDEEDCPFDQPKYPDEDYDDNYQFTDDDEPSFPSIGSDNYYTPDTTPEHSYHTANSVPYEDLEDYCCAYCAGQHPDTWCPTPHYSCLDTCLVPEDHPHYIDDAPVDVTCPAEGQHRPSSYWARFWWHRT